MEQRIEEWNGAITRISDRLNEKWENIVRQGRARLGIWTLMCVCAFLSLIHAVYDYICMPQYYIDRNGGDIATAHAVALFATIVFGCIALFSWCWLYGRRYFGRRE